MKISVCPKCYEKGKVNEGSHINDCKINNLWYSMYFCNECKDSYKEN